MVIDFSNVTADTDIDEDDLSDEDIANLDLQITVVELKLEVFLMKLLLDKVTTA